MRRRAVAEAAPKTAAQSLAAQAMDEMFERAGVGPKAEAAAAARMKELGRRDDLTADEQRELGKLVKRRDKDRRQDRKFNERSARARRRWAKRSLSDPAWVAKWNERAIEGHRKYDRTGVSKAITGEALYHLHVVTQEKKRQRRAAAERTLRAAETAAAKLELEKVAAKVADKAPGSPRATTPPATVQKAPLPAERAPVKRQGPKYGIVAQFDRDGNRLT